MNNAERIAYHENVDTMNLAEAKHAWKLLDHSEDGDKAEIILRHVTILMSEDSDYDPDSGDNEPDFLSAAKDFLARE